MEVPETWNPEDVLTSPDATALADLLVRLSRPLKPRAVEVGTATLTPGPGQPPVEV